MPKATVSSGGSNAWADAEAAAEAEVTTDPGASPEATTAGQELPASVPDPPDPEPERPAGKAGKAQEKPQDIVASGGLTLKKPGVSGA